MRFFGRHDISRAARKYNGVRSCICFWLKQYDRTSESLACKQANRLTAFEATALTLDIQLKHIKPYTPRHNDKVERNQEDQKRFTTSTVFTHLMIFPGSSLLGKTRAAGSPCVRSAAYSPSSSFTNPLSNMLDKPTYICNYDTYYNT